MRSSAKTVLSRKKRTQFTLSDVGAALLTLGDELIMKPAALIMHRSKTDYVSFGTMLIAACEIGVHTTPLTGLTMGASTLLVAWTQTPKATPKGLYTGWMHNKSKASLNQIVRRVTINTGCMVGCAAAALGGLSTYQTHMLNNSPEAQQALLLIKSGAEITQGQQLHNPKDSRHKALGKITIQSRNEPWSDGWDQIPWYKPWAKPWIKRSQEFWAKLPFHPAGTVTCKIPTPYTNWVTGQQHATFPVKLSFGTRNSEGQVGPFKTLRLSFETDINRYSSTFTPANP
ncbi:MAG: hypothetical protein PHD48_04795 [Alphaproteobacteria bacterium]|nr:hypothetical protein [Alphaproteobacteria bacterium]